MPVKPTPIRQAASIAGLKDQLDREGSAYDQVTRERVDNVADDIAEIKSRVGTIESHATLILSGVILNLLGFVATLVVFILNRLH